MRHGPQEEAACNVDIIHIAVGFWLNSNKDWLLKAGVYSLTLNPISDLRWYPNQSINEHVSHNETR